jgi:hypothetical protein
VALRWWNPQRPGTNPSARGFPERDYRIAEESPPS